MNTRFLWNFEIDSTNLLNVQNNFTDKELLRWEARFFWPQDTVITLHGLNDSFLLPSHYEIKPRNDCYLLLNQPLNIKKRKDTLLYKPLLQKSDSLCAYGKKIDLLAFPREEILPGTTLTTQALLDAINRESVEIPICKEALIYTFPTEPKIKLELARLEIQGKIYYSVSVEGRSQSLVRKIVQHMLKTSRFSNYVCFLKQLLQHHE